MNSNDPHDGLIKLLKQTTYKDKTDEEIKTIVFKDDASFESALKSAYDAMPSNIDYGSFRKKYYDKYGSPFEKKKASSTSSLVGSGASEQVEQPATAEAPLEAGIPEPPVFDMEKHFYREGEARAKKTAIKEAGDNLNIDGTADPIEAGEIYRKQHEDAYGYNRKYDLATDERRDFRMLKNVELHLDQLGRQRESAIVGLEERFGKDWTDKFQSSIDTYDQLKDKKDITGEEEVALQNAYYDLKLFQDDHNFIRLQNSEKGIFKSDAYIKGIMAGRWMGELAIEQKEADASDAAAMAALPGSLPGQRAILEYMANKVGKIASRSTLSFLKLPRLIDSLVREKKDKEDWGIWDTWGSMLDEADYQTKKTLTDPSRKTRPVFENVATFDGKQYVLDDKKNITMVRDDRGTDITDQVSQEEINKFYDSGTEARHKFTGAAPFFDKAIDVAADLAIMRTAGAGLATQASTTSQALALSRAGVTATAFANISAGAYDEAVKDLELSPDEAAAYAVTTAAIQSVIETFVGNIETAGVSKATIANATRNANQVVRANVGKLGGAELARLKWETVFKVVVPELGEEGAQLVTDNVTRIFTNTMAGSNLELADEYDVAETFLLTTLVTAPVGAITTNVKSDLANSAYLLAVHKPDKYKRVLDELLSSGTIDAPTAQREKDKIDAMQEVVATLPRNLSTDNMAAVMGLTAKKLDIENLPITKETKKNLTEQIDTEIERLILQEDSGAAARMDATAAVPPLSGEGQKGAAPSENTIKTRNAVREGVGAVQEKAVSPVRMLEEIIEDETPALEDEKIISTDGLPDLEVVASKEVDSALESEIGADKGVIDGKVRYIPVQEFDYTHNKRSAQIAEEISENGWIEPLIVSFDKDGNIYTVEGQHRGAALQQLGYDKAPVRVIYQPSQSKKAPVIPEVVEPVVEPTVEQVEEIPVPPEQIEEPPEKLPKPKSNIEDVEEITSTELDEFDSLLSGEAQKRRDKGEYTKDGVTHKRQEPINTPKGKAGKVTFAEKEDVDFEYQLIEADQLQPAHLGGSRNPAFFITEAQPKNRTDKASQKQSDKIAADPEFEKLSENTLAYSGAPVVNERGETIQGNNRSEGIKKHYKQGKTKYKEQLAENADKFGFTPEQVASMDKPVLVRTVKADDDRVIQLGNYDVKDIETGGKRRIDPVATSRRIPKAKKAELTKILFGDDPDQTLNNAIRSKQDAVVRALKPYLNDAQLSSLTDKSGNIKPEALKDVENLVQHFLFEDGDANLPEMFEGLSGFAREGLLKSIPKLFSLPSAKGLLKEVQGAISAYNAFVNSGVKNFGDWISQRDMFSGQAPSEKYNEVELKIAEILLEAKTQKEVREIFGRYYELAVGKPGDMFEAATEPVTKKESIKQIFNVDEKIKQGTATKTEVAGTGTTGSQGESEITAAEITAVDEEISEADLISEDIEVALSEFADKKVQTSKTERVAHGKGFLNKPVKVKPTKEQRAKLSSAIRTAVEAPTKENKAAARDAFIEIYESPYTGSKKVKEIWKQLTETFPELKEETSEFIKATSRIQTNVPKAKLGGIGGSVPLTNLIGQQNPNLNNQTKFQNPDAEERFSKAAANTKSFKKAVSNVGDKLRVFFKDFTKKYPYLNYRKHADVANKLRELDSIRNYAVDVSKNYVESLVSPLTADQYGLFTRSIILRDLVDSIENGMEVESNLPFGFTSLQEIKDELANIDSLVLAEPDVKQAVDMREQAMSALHADLVSAGLISDADYRAYFHRRTLKYLAEEHSAPGGKPVPKGRKGFQKSRTGSRGLDYSTNYVESEFKVVTEALYEIERKRIIDEILTPYKAEMKKLRAESLQAYKDELDQIKNTFGDTSPEYTAFKDGKKMWRLDWESENTPDGMIIWQPVRGNNMFKAKLASEQEIEALLSQSAMTGNIMGMSQQYIKAMAQAITRDYIIMGGKKTEYLIPEDIATTFEDLGTGKRDANAFESTLHSLSRLWKVNVLLNPRRFLKYNLNNTSGDLDALIAADPTILKYTKKSFLMVKDYALNGVMTDEIREALKHGVLSSSLSFVEFADINDADFVKNLMSKNTVLQNVVSKSTFERITDVAKNPIKSYFEAAQKYTNLRENVFRMAAFTRAKEKTATGKPFYWASQKYQIDQIKDDTERSAKLAREVLGDYGNISSAGEWMRKHLIPFYSWIEINMGRYFNLTANAINGGGIQKGNLAKGLTIKAGRVAVAYAQMAAFTIAIKLWNKGVHSECDKKMRAAKTDGMYVIVGKNADGTCKTIPIQGAFYDFLQKFGLKNIEEIVDELISGNADIAEIGAEMGKAPIQEIANGLNPMLKAVYELPAAQSLYPDVFNPVRIRDRGEYLARMIQMHDTYRAIKGLPMKHGYLDPKRLNAFITYDFDPDEIAYYAVKNKISKEFGGGVSIAGKATSERTDALYYYKQALRYKDETAANEWLTKFYELGGMDESIETSTRTAHPLHSASSEAKADIEDILDNYPPETEFGKSLTKKDIARIRMAIDYYERTYPVE